MVIIDIKFEAAKRNAFEMMECLKKMMVILDELEKKVDSMKWSGSNASRFKNSIKDVKSELDNVYKNKISIIPEKIEASVRNYQMNEQ